MTDRAIEIIEGTESGLISFAWFRSAFKSDNGLKESLNYGHAVIENADQLDQYLYTYGPMIESQWNHVAPYILEIGQPSLLIDYGCGQGLAGLFLNDLTYGKLFETVRDIFLIEPSAVALARSKALYERIAPAATVTGICKLFDALGENEIAPERADKTLHVFSNSLDVRGFDPLKLLGKTLQAGHNTIFSVSHDRDFNGGTPRIEGVKAAFEDPSMATDLTIQRSTLERFTCDNPSQSKGAVWLCELEIEDG